MARLRVPRPSAAIDGVNRPTVTLAAALAEGHRGRLDALHAHIAAPRRGVDCFGVLFGRRIDDRVYGLATGEAMAHLRRLEVEGRAVREVRDGVSYYSQA